MSIQEVSAEQLAKLFNHYHKVLALGFASRKQSMRESWDALPKDEKNRAVAVARLALLELRSSAKERENSRPYFAPAGEAEWGC